MLGFKAESGALLQLVRCTERFCAVKDESLLSVVTIDEIAWRIGSADDSAAELRRSE
ncbi:TPA: hypothetical protein UM518_000824 [Stenotrophomonas maltophilia]|nr:hypothetical protein [Stenotrophomonas maltophilia]